MPRSRTIPGFGLSMGYALSYLSLLVLIPLAGLVLKTSQLTWGQFVKVVTDPVVVASYRLSFQASFAAAVLNAVFGLVVAWTLVRYRFPGRRLFDAIVDFPFALPTAVAGLTFGSLYAKVAWIDRIRIGSWMTAGINTVMGWVGSRGISHQSLAGFDQFRVIIMLAFVSL